MLQILIIFSGPVRATSTRDVMFFMRRATESQSRPFVWIRVYCTVVQCHSLRCLFRSPIQHSLPFAVTKLVRQKCKLANKEKKRFNFAIFSACFVIYSQRFQFAWLCVSGAEKLLPRRASQSKEASSRSMIIAVNLVLYSLAQYAGARRKLKHLIALLTKMRKEKIKSRKIVRACYRYAAATLSLYLHSNWISNLCRHDFGLYSNGIRCEQNLHFSSLNSNYSSSFKYCNYSFHFTD